MLLSADLLALLNNCRATPADDLPRLVLADWLDEHDDPARADLIRVQCDLARPSLDTEHVAALKLRERALIADNWRTWAGGLHEACCDRIDRSSDAEIVPFGARAWEHTPNGSSLTPPAMSDPSDNALPWGFSRGLLRLTVVTSAWLYSRGLSQWLSCDEVHWLEVVRFPVRDAALSDIADMPMRLHPYIGVELTLAHAPAALPGLPEFRRYPHSAPIPDRPVTPRELDAVVAETRWRHVRHLAVTCHEESGPLVAALTRASFVYLTHLRLDGPNSPAIAAGAARKRLTRLVSLDVGGTGVPAATLLAMCRRAPRLNVLSCYRTPFTPAEFAALLASPCGETLHTLEVMNCGLGDAAIVSLVRSGLLGRLYGPQLNLSMNPFGDAGLSALAGSEDLLRFSELILRECHAGDAGVEALAASPFAANLRYLDLWKNRLTDRAAVALASSPHLGQLRDLNVRDNGLTERGRAVLTARYGAAAKVGI